MHFHSVTLPAFDPLSSKEWRVDLVVCKCLLLLGLLEWRACRHFAAEMSPIFQTLERVHVVLLIRVQLIMFLKVQRLQHDPYSFAKGIFSFICLNRVRFCRVSRHASFFGAI